MKAAWCCDHVCGAAGRWLRASWTSTTGWRLMSGRWGCESLCPTRRPSRALGSASTPTLHGTRI